MKQNSVKILLLFFGFSAEFWLAGWNMHLLQFCHEVWILQCETEFCQNSAAVFGFSAEFWLAGGNMHLLYSMMKFEFCRLKQNSVKILLLFLDSQQNFGWLEGICIYFILWWSLNSVKILLLFLDFQQNSGWLEGICTDFVLWWSLISRMWNNIRSKFCCRFWILNRIVVDKDTACTFMHDKV